MTRTQTEEQLIEQEMPLLVQREKLRRRIEQGILKLLLCDLEKLSAAFVLKLQKDLEDWFK